MNPVIALMNRRRYLGGTADASNSAGEGLAVIGAIYGSVAMGFTEFPIPPEMITIYADPNGIAWNNPGTLSPIVIPTFWYASPLSIIVTLSVYRTPLRMQYFELSQLHSIWYGSSPPHLLRFGSLSAPFHLLRFEHSRQST
jgi:hypothetical protein